MLNALEIRAAKTAFVASVCMLTTTFIAGGIYWQHNGRQAENKLSPESGVIVGKGQSFFLQVARTAMVRTRMEGKMHPVC